MMIGKMKVGVMKSLGPKQVKYLYSQQSGAVSKKSEYVQEHDYTITPNTYVYTSTENQELFERFPLVTSRVLARRSQRPRKTRMLAREFIEDSMYHPQYGYFSKSAQIFSLPEKFDMNKMSNLDSFLDQWSVEYKKQMNQDSNGENSGEKPRPKLPASVPEHERKNMRVTRVSKQLWHTPSELFSPHYGEALARYIVAKREERIRGQGEVGHQENQNLVIYETGAGNGTLMADILNYLKKQHPEIYKTVSYNIIEISGQLSLKQRVQAEGHSDKVCLHNRSIFEWNKVETRPCFFLALEVWDNLAHDIVRYDNTTDEPHQGYVVIDSQGDFTELFSPKLDKPLEEFLQVRNQVAYKPQSQLGWHPLNQPKQIRSLANMVIPFRGNLSQPEYVPTRQFQMMQILKEFFPQHSLMAADFTHLTETITGYNSPVVQTFMENVPVAVSTFMVLQGHFDIMFPTDFELTRKMYEQIMGKPAEHLSHQVFLKRWVGDSAETATKTGENPMLSLYSNAAFICS